MPFAGQQLLPRDIARLCHDAGWRDLDLIKIVATCLAESMGFTEAWHDNLGPDELDNELISRDVGLFQINIPGSQVGTKRETDLRDPVKNVQAARDLWERRRYQPWVSYTTGWVLFTEWWIWARPTLDHWTPTGRYLHKALRGVANFHREELGLSQTLAWRGVPRKPTKAPADGVGPRPTPNDGSR